MTDPRLLVGFAVETSDPRLLTSQVVSAERAGLSFVHFHDEPGAPSDGDRRGALDPIECASFASAHTRAIGLLATAAATHAEPYHLSNRFSSLDWGSRGRAAWLVTVDRSADRARAYSATPPSAADAVREADAVVDAARRLWDSWEDGALIADTTTGRFLDADKLHYVDAGGDLFRIKGPALLPRPIQGQVVVVARTSDGLTGADVALHDGRAAGASLSTRDAGVDTGAAPGPKAFVELHVDGDPLPVLRDLAGTVDGVLLTGITLGTLEQRVLPALIADGVLVPPHPGQTFRDQLGLPRPASRYTTGAVA